MPDPVIAHRDLDYLRQARADAAQAARDARSSPSSGWQQLNQARQAHDATRAADQLGQNLDRINQMQQGDLEDQLRYTADMAGNLRDWLDAIPPLPGPDLFLDWAKLALGNISDKLNELMGPRTPPPPPTPGALSPWAEGPGGGWGPNADAPGGAPWFHNGGLGKFQLDPIVLDLDGDGIELIGLSQSQTYFDYDGDGFRETTGWVTGGDGLLCIDLDNSGTIDNLGELFGSLLEDGLSVLSSYDTNHDGKISALDAIFTTLRIWVDADQDGQTDTGELFTLTQLGVTEVSTSRTFSNTTVDGNRTAFTSTFVGPNGTAGSAVVYFGVDRVHSQFQLPSNFVYDPDTEFLPEMTGYGEVPDLRVAMTLDSDLLDAVQALVTQSSTLSYADMRTAIENIVAMWADADGVAANSRGPYVNGQHLAILEAFYGIDFVQVFAGTVTTNPWEQVGGELEVMYQHLIDFFGSMFVAQVALSDYATNPDVDMALANPYAVFSNYAYDGTVDSAALSFQSVLNNMVLEYYLADPGTGFSGLLITLPWLQASLNYQFDGDSEALADAIALAVRQLTEDASVAAVFAGLIGNPHVVDMEDGDAAVGTAGIDVFNLDGAVSTIAGGQGDDLYIYGHGRGAVTIGDGGTASFADKLILTQTDSDRVILTRDGADLVITFPGWPSDSIRIVGQFDALAWNQIESIVFSDTTWTAAYLRQVMVDQQATEDDDTITGFYGNDQIAGGLGDDVLIGAAGDDNYIYAVGDGADIVRDGGIASTDTITFVGIDLDDVVMTRASDDPNDLILTIGSGSVRVDGQFDGLGWDRIENFVFADQTLTWSQVITHFLEHAGTAGADTIRGFATNDLMIGRGGDDLLLGGAGDDTYIFTANDGSDTVRDGGIASVDTVRFDGVNFADVTFSRASNNSNDLILTVAGGGTVRIEGQFDSLGRDRIEYFQFADQTINWVAAAARVLEQAGTSGNDTIRGFATDDVIEGRGGDDFLIGGAGNDTYIYRAGDGNDVISDGGIGSIDYLDLIGINLSDVTFSRATDDANDLIMTFAGGGSVRIDDQFDSLAWFRMESIHFASGETLTHADILGFV